MRRILSVLFIVGVFVGYIFLFAQTPEPQSQAEQMEEQMGEPSPQTEQPTQEQPSQETVEQPEKQHKKKETVMQLESGKYVFEMPPKSLDNYYPPVARRAKNYKAYMDTLGRRFYDLVADINAVDLEVIEVSYTRFKDYYSFVADLVPEWKDRFLLSEVEELGKVLGIIKDTTDTTKTQKKDTVLPIGARRSLDPKVSNLIKKLEYSCKACHLQEIPKVYFRYYWQTKDMKMNMATFIVKDPMTKRKMPYRDFKSEMSKDYYTILRAIDKGSKVELRRFVRKFIKRFNYNQSLCSKCHREDPYLFTTPTIATLVKDLDNEANKRIPSKKRLRRVLYELYRSNCTGCHRVHFPATYIQRFWYDQLPKPPEEIAAQPTQPPEQTAESPQPEQTPPEQAPVETPTPEQPEQPTE